MRALQMVVERELKSMDLPEPEAPAPGEVQLRVRVVALNHIDVWGWRGMAFAKRQLPLTIGTEASAEVVAVGDGVSNLSPGQLVSLFGGRVCGTCVACRSGRDNLCLDVGGVHGFHLDGFARELLNLSARQCVPVPAGCDDVGAALAPITFGTCEHMLFDNALLKPSESILIQAGGSGIGSAAIQLAKAINCRVIATVGSDEKIEPATALGADHVINYRKDRFEGVVRKLTMKEGVDVVFEHVGKKTWAGSMLSLKRGGRLVICGSTSGISAETNLMMLFQRQLRLIGSFGCRIQNMVDSMDKIAAGTVKPVIDTEIEFGEMATALGRMEDRKVFGKIIMRIS